MCQAETAVCLYVYGCMYTGVCVCVGTIALARASVLLSTLRLSQSVIEECRAGGRENSASLPSNPTKALFAHEDKQDGRKRVQWEFSLQPLPKLRGVHELKKTGLAEPKSVKKTHATTNAQYHRLTETKSTNMLPRRFCRVWVGVRAPCSRDTSPHLTPVSMGKLGPDFLSSCKSSMRANLP